MIELVVVQVVEHFEVWSTCLQRCEELLGECMNVLCGEGVDEALLEEITKHSDSQDNLRGGLAHGSIAVVVKCLLIL